MTLSALTPWFWVAAAGLVIVATALWLATRAPQVVNEIPGKKTERQSPEAEFSEFLDSTPEGGPRAS